MPETSTHTNLTPDASSRDRAMQIGEHFGELRQRLIRILIAIAITTLLCISFSETLLEILTRPVLAAMNEVKPGQEQSFLIELRPGEALMSRLKIAFYAGFLLASPYLFYEVWGFIALGLHAHERRFVYYFAPLISACFIIGTLFTYFMVLPYGLYFLLDMNPSWIHSQYAISAYVSTCVSMALAFGLVFELPLIMLFVTRLGFVDWKWFAKYRRHAYFISVVVAAILTPPDPVTQLMMALPVMVLYEIGIQLSKINIRALINADENHSTQEDDES